MSLLQPRWRAGRALIAPAAGLAAVLLLSGAATPAPRAAAATTPAARAVPDGAHTVTLVTGDVVRVADAGGGKHTVEVTRPHGVRGGVRAETVGKDLYVLPDEALPYLAADRVDRR